MAYSHNNTYNSTANTSWVAPQNGNFFVETWGGGGGGGSYGRTTAAHGAGGGGGGAYAASMVSAVSGTSYTIAIGAGGANGANNANGSTGGYTHFNNNEVKAAGGIGGNRGGALGAGGTTANSTGTTEYAGGAGAANALMVGGGAGSGGWDSETGKAASGATGGAGGNGGGNGGNGGASNTAGENGTLPGGGGGGSGGNLGTTFKRPGTGANGQIKISWNDQLSPNPSQGVASIGAQPVVVTDNFQAYADSTYLVSGAGIGQGNWIPGISDSWVVWDVSGNKVASTYKAGAYSCAIYNQAISPNQYAQVKRTDVTTAAYTGIGVRLSGIDSTLCGYAFLISGTANDSTLVRLDNGVETVLGTSGTTDPSVNDVYKLTVDGNYLVVYKNGVVFTEVGNRGSWIDSTYATGKVGLVGYDASNNARVDEFEGGVMPTQNICLYSEQIDNATWGKTETTVTANQANDSLGNNTLDKINDDGTHGVDVYQNDIKCKPNTTYKIEFDAKRGTSAAQYMNINVYVDEDDYTTVIANFDYGVYCSTSEVRRFTFLFTTTANCVNVNIALLKDYIYGTSYLGRVCVSEVNKSYATTDSTAVDESGKATLTAAAADSHRTGTISGVASTSLMVGAKGRKTGTISGIASTSLTTGAKGRKTGTISGISSDSLTTGAKGRKTGTISGIASDSLTTGAKGRKTGQINGTSSDSLTVGAKGRKTGQIDGIASLTAFLSGKANRSGQTDGIASLTLTTGAKGRKTGQSNGITSTTGVLIGWGRKTGQIDGSSSDSGLLIGYGRRTGVIDGSSSTTASMSANINGRLCGQCGFGFSTQQETDYSTNFEAYNTGYLDGQDGWVCEPPQTNSLVIAEADGNKYAKSQASGLHYVTKPFLFDSIYFRKVGATLSGFSGYNIICRTGSILIDVITSKVYILVYMNDYTLQVESAVLPVDGDMWDVETLETKLTIRKNGQIASELGSPVGGIGGSGSGGQYILNDIVALDSDATMIVNHVTSKIDNYICIIKGAAQFGDLVIGVLSAKVSISGATNGVASLTGTITGEAIFSGQINGLSSTSLTVGAKGRKSGSVSGVASTTANLTAHGILSATTSGVASLTGAIHGHGRLAITITGIASLTGTIHGHGSLISSSTGIASLTAVIHGHGSLIGSTSGIASLALTTGAKGRKSGQVNGIATTTATFGAIPTPISGAINGIASLSVLVSAKGRKSGVISGISSTSAIIHGNGRLTGATTIQTADSGTLSGLGNLTANSTSVASVFGALSALAGEGVLSGYIDISISNEADIKGFGRFSGNIVTSATVSGIIRGIGTLLGYTDIQTDVSGNIKGFGRIKGQSDIVFDSIVDIISAHFSGNSLIAFGVDGSLRIAKLHYETICGCSYITISIVRDSLITGITDGDSVITPIFEGDSQITLCIDSDSGIVSEINESSLIKEGNEQCIC